MPLSLHAQQVELVAVKTISDALVTARLASMFDGGVAPEPLSVAR